MKQSPNTNSSFDCFGLVIRGFDYAGFLEQADQANRLGKQVMAVTANPEILLYAKRHPDYWNVLRQADFRLVDSFGLGLAGRFKGAKPSRLAGVDLAWRLCATAQDRGWKIGLIGGEAGIADKAAWKLRQSFPSLQVMAEQGGKAMPDGTDDEAGAEARYRLTHFAPDILLVAFGHPRQEAWIARNLHDMPSVKIALGIGGTLDFWSGAKERAPAWMRRLGLEWLYRLIREPSRAKRIFDAVFIFPWHVAGDALSSPKNNRP
jgi:N-acetylglucosaminyldiphosphoundecaprenol N-acetyl-beta-D-mannosaminyltransferase